MPPKKAVVSSESVVYLQHRCGACGKVQIDKKAVIDESSLCKCERHDGE